MLRRACSRVQVVPFKRPEVLARKGLPRNHINSMGLLCKEVRRPDDQTPVAMSTMLVPMPTLPVLHSQPSSTPCMRVCIDFWDDLADIALAHLAPGHHIFVSGSLDIPSYSMAFRVRTRILKFVLDDSPLDSNNTHPGTLQALAIDDASQWQAYFHSPSEWLDYRPLKRMGSILPDFKHKYTGVFLFVSATSTPEWVKARLARKSELSAPSHGILHPSDGENLAA